MPARPVVMVVEDQTELGDVIRDIFGEEGYDVLTVRDQYAAMGELRHREVDLLVADLPVSLPGEGDPLAEISREFPDLRLVVVTDASQEQVPFFGPWRVSGLRVSLRRPFRLADLVAASREAVG
jgi:DNA-binding response OmpR family regulator